MHRLHLLEMAIAASRGEASHIETQRDATPQGGPMG